MNAWFRDHNAGIISTSTSSGFYQTRKTGAVRLHYNNGGILEGIFYCRILVSASELQTLYVGVYPSVNDNDGGGVNGDGKSVRIPSKIHHTVV